MKPSAHPGQLRESGSSTLHDRHTTSKKMPGLDSQPTWHLAALSEQRILSPVAGHRKRKRCHRMLSDRLQFVADCTYTIYA